ncbi:STAS domain-containing protein [Bdellovibrionota bacterium FG-2]
MKLSRVVEKNIEILQATGPITAQEALVLRAGISKLLGLGKNMLILELTDSTGIALEALQELAKLNDLARDLGGMIALSGVTPEMKQVIDKFSMPPPVPCFRDRNSAMMAFLKPPKAGTGSKAPHFSGPAVAAKASVTPPPAAPTPAPAKPGVAPQVAAKPGAKPGAPKAKVPAAPQAVLPPMTLDEKEKEILRLREELRKREEGELGALRRELATLRLDNDAIKEQLKKMVFVRRNPPDEGAYQKKIQLLETRVVELLGRIAAKH